MESVEELCDNVALINKSRKVLDGPKKQIKEQFKTHTYKVEYLGDLSGEFEDFDIVKTETVEDNYKKSTIKLKPEVHANQLVKQLIDKVELRTFGENIPSMNDIFIAAVNEIPQ